MVSFTLVYVMPVMAVKIKNGLFEPHVIIGICSVWIVVCHFEIGYSYQISIFLVLQLFSNFAALSEFKAWLPTCYFYPKVIWSP